LRAYLVAMAYANAEHVLQTRKWKVHDVRHSTWLPWR
jgi:hypothetical protein